MGGETDQKLQPPQMSSLRHQLQESPPIPFRRESSQPGAKCTRRLALGPTQLSPDMPLVSPQGVLSLLGSRP